VAGSPSPIRPRSGTSTARNQLNGSAERGFVLQKQTRQESNLQPPVFEPTPSNAGVAAFVDFQRLSFGPATPALLDNAGVGTNPGICFGAVPDVKGAVAARCSPC